MATKRGLRRGAASRDSDDCVEISARVRRAKRQVDSARDPRTRARLLTKLRAFQTTENAMGCQATLGRTRRRSGRRR